MPLTREQLIRAVQIELRCVQEYTRLADGCMPEALWENVRQHVETAHMLSQQLWDQFQVSIHNHPPMDKDTMRF